MILEIGPNKSRSFLPQKSAIQAFSLIEIVLALMILSLILSIAIPSLKTYFVEQKLRSSLRQFETVLQNARHLAMTSQHPYRLHFTDKKIELYDASIAADEKSTPLVTESFLPGIKFREKIDETPTRYTIPEDWILSVQGLCDPLRFRFTHDQSWMEFSIHPLDGSLQNLEFKIE